MAEGNPDRCEDELQAKLQELDHELEVRRIAAISLILVAPKFAQCMYSDEAGLTIALTGRRPYREGVRPHQFLLNQYP